MIRFNITARDADIRGEVDDDGFATLRVWNIRDAVGLALAIIRTRKEGAKRGMLFSGGIVNDEIASKNVKRVQRGTTWLGGRFTRLPDEDGEICFRIDWDEWPSITE